MNATAPRTPLRRRLPRRLGIVNRQLGDFTLKNLINLGAVTGACLLLVAPSSSLQLLAALSASASFVAIVGRSRGAVIQPSRRDLLGYFVSVRAVLFVAVGAGYSSQRPDESGWIWAATAVGMLMTLSEPLLHGLLATTKQVVVNLPGVRPVPDPPFRPGWLATISLAEILLGGLLGVAGAPGWLYLALVVLSVPPVAAIAWHAVQSNLTSGRAVAAISSALKQYRPTFVVYYAARKGAKYQLGMWLPYFERLNSPFIVITRLPETVPEIEKVTTAPILVPKLDDVSASLDAMVSPSLNAAFYVQGDPANQTLQRYRQLTHIWLNHGDDDKEASVHPRHATYDKLFLPGQQAVDRYATRGMNIPPERFVIIGRPQIETITPLVEAPPPGAPRTVLYAPTWKGGRPSTNYCSLTVGQQIVAALVDRGCTVIFRPHPLSVTDPEDSKRIRAIHHLLRKDSAGAGGGRHHVWGARAEEEWDLPTCFNASDALICDVSSVANDYLAADKPLAMVAITAAGEAFREKFATARVAYVIEKDLSTLPTVLDQLHGEDTLAAARRSYRRYCMGDHVGPQAAEPFLRIAGEFIAGRAR